MEQSLTIISGFIIGGIVGVIVGFSIGARRSKSDQINSLTWTQVIGSALTALLSMLILRQGRSLSFMRHTGRN